MRSVRELASVIAADLATWAPHPPHVELAIFCTTDAREIAARLDELCVAALGAPIAVAYDWDSLARDREPALVGGCAHAFTADWTREGRAQAPTLDEARAFVAEYEAARGRPFDRAERAACAATFAYACAYTARCGHALGRDERDAPGTFQHLVARHGRDLLVP
jgi:hypothetical protein